MLTFLAGHCFFSFSTSISRCSSSNRKTLLLKNSESCEIIAKILQASLSNHKTEAEKKQVKIGKSIVSLLSQQPKDIFHMNLCIVFPASAAQLGKSLN